MYHNSSLFITANDNYNCDKKRFLVCLKIIVDNDVNIIAQTKTFSHPRSQKDLIDAQYIFQKGQYLGDEQWSATALKPVIIKKNVKYNYDQLPLDSVYILKNYTANKNTVPYWVFDPKLYKNGKLFVYHHVLDLVNKSFKDLICLSFTHYTLIDYTEFLPQKDLLKLIEKSLKDFKLGFLDPFDTKYSRLFIQGLQKQINTFVPSITYCDYPNCDLLINLCEPKQSKDNEENSEISYYAKGKTRKQFSHLALQHIEFDIEALKDYSTDKEQKKLVIITRRLLTELVVKRALIDRQIPKELDTLGFEFINYKINNNTVHGAVLKTIADNNNTHNSIQIEKIGLKELGVGACFESFMQEHVPFKGDINKFKGSDDYKILKKDGNCYLILDTSEIHILNAENIEKGYDLIVNHNEKLSIFKNRDTQFLYVGGVIGLHLWQIPSHDDEIKAIYAYTSGVYFNHLKGVSEQYIKPPHVRYILVLDAQKTDRIKDDIEQIINLLKFGFGRWNEMMTYPFAFKFLSEFLENECLILYGKKWSEIGMSTDLMKNYLTTHKA